MTKMKLTSKKLMVSVSVLALFQLAGCTTGTSFADEMLSSASKIQGYSEEWKQGADLMDDGLDLLKDGEKNVAKGQKDLSKGIDLVREGTLQVEENRQAHLLASSKKGQTGNPDDLATEVEKLEDIASEWKDGEKSVTKGNELIQQGNERINEGQQEISEGKQKISEGRALKLESERKYQNSSAKAGNTSETSEQES